MPTQEERLAALERDAAIMRRDFTKVLGEVNRSITMLQVSFGVLNEDIGLLKLRMQDQMEAINDRFARVDDRFDGVSVHLENLQRQQDMQGQDIKQRFAAVDQRFDAQDHKLDAILNLLKSNGNAS